MIKRLSNKWMARVAFSYQDWKEYLDGPGAVENPTRNDVTGGTTGGGMPASGPQVDDGFVAPRSTGSGKGDIFYNSKWQVNANALYELPANFEISASLYGRQGFPRPIVLALGSGNDGSVRTLGTTNLDDNTYPNLWNFDLRLANNIRLGGERSLTIAAELFNVFKQQHRAQPSASGHVERLRAPRRGAEPARAATRRPPHVLENTLESYRRPRGHPGAFFRLRAWRRAHDAALDPHRSAAELSPSQTGRNSANPLSFISFDPFKPPASDLLHWRAAGRTNASRILEVETMQRAIGLALAIALIVAPAAFAQISGGNIYGKVTDESGAVLPGANVVLTGDAGTQATVSGTGGEFRFLSVSQGDYELAVSLSGFTTITRKLVLVTNQNVDLDFTLKVATVEETLLVTAETPVVDTKKLGTNTTLTRDELQRVPQARDPWAVLRTIPGVVVDRVNIAGSESGQQASFQAKGTDDVNISWNLDGVQIEDVAATGASPSYYDYDAFEEIAVTTGGNALQTKTGAIGINFVTKRGTNRWRGSARGLITHDDMQWSNVAGTDFEGDPRLQGNDKAGSHPAGERLRRRVRRADHQGQAPHLGLLRQAGRAPGALEPDGRQDQPRVVQRQAQLADQPEHRLLGLLLQRQEDQDRP